MKLLQNLTSDIISKQDQQFQRRFLKNYLKNSMPLPWQPEFLMESNSVNKFGPNWPRDLGGKNFKEIVYDRQQTPCDPKSSP